MEIHMSRVVSPKEKRPPGRTPKYTVEYYMIARKVVDEGMSYSEASKTFNVSEGAISAYIVQPPHIEYCGLSAVETPGGSYGLGDSQ